MRVGGDGIWCSDERDAETAYGTTSGNDYAFARYYNARLGRFMSADPLAGDITDPQTLNRYAYVRNNPVNFTDPTGMGPAEPGDPTMVISGGPLCDNIGGNCAGGPPYPPQPPVSPSQVKPPAPKPKPQTFSQCMAANSAAFSLAGAAQGAINGLLGTSFEFRDNTLVQFVGGNSITTLLFGSASAAAVTGASNTPGILNIAMGNVTTYGRRSSTIMSLNIAGRGGLPQALSSASGSLKSILGIADRVLSLGLDFTTRLEIDAALTALEVAYCKTR